MILVNSFSEKVSSSAQYFTTGGVAKNGSIIAFTFGYHSFS